MKNCLALVSNVQNNLGIVQGLTLSVNSIIFIIVGAIIATFGLFYNSYPTILGSMLISPVGNSIIRYSLGYIYTYHMFMKQGFQSLTAQIVIALVIGYSMGLINNYAGNRYKLPTDEMEARLNTENYSTDFMIALLCGFILAYSLIYKQIVAIVGLGLVVAVLPPLTNAGIYTSMAHTSQSLEEYNMNMSKALKTFSLAIINILGISFACIIGLYVFC